MMANVTLYIHLIMEDQDSHANELPNDTRYELTTKRHRWHLDVDGMRYLGSS